MQKRLMTLFLAAGLVFGCLTSASAVDFKAQGEWLFGWGGVESTMTKDNNGGRDVFDARQRLRLQMEAVASEALSGTLRLQIGDIAWGKAEDGGALGADGKIVGVLDAYLDWTAPDTALSVRMGIQPVALPNVAGGSPILDEDGLAAIVASYRFNDNVALTAFWLRPFNDNYTGFLASSRRDRSDRGYKDPAGFLDNADYAGLTLPLTFDGVEVTPWAMIGFVGRNALDPYDGDPADGGESLDGPNLFWNMPVSYTNGDVVDGSLNDRSMSYATQFFAGIPFSITAFDPFNIELDINYGYSSGFGKYSVIDRPGVQRRASSERQGWLVKGLVEYKMDWGAPGILGWYGSGDDGNVKNGSERMPAMSPSANFTSFMQDGPNGWSLDGGYDKMLTFDGTWGLGLQLRDVSFVEDLSHTLRVVYWGGTNSPSMIKQTNDPQAWRNDDGIYLTTLDHLVELNLDTNYKIYENLEAIVELGYIFNGVDRDAWRKHSAEKSYQNADAWKAALVMKYEF